MYRRHLNNQLVSELLLLHQFPLIKQTLLPHPYQLPSCPCKPLLHSPKTPSIQLCGGRSCSRQWHRLQ